MRTIAIEEHFLSRGFKEGMQRKTPVQEGDLNLKLTSGCLVKLSNLSSLRLQEMDTGGIDLQGGNRKGENSDEDA